MNLDKKAIGKYYTPKILAKYFTNLSLINFLVDNINSNFNTSFNSLESALRSDDQYNSKISLFLLSNVLIKLKVLDNACGTGIYLVSTLEDLIRIWNKLIILQKSNTRLINHIFHKTAEKLTIS